MKKLMLFCSMVGMVCMSQANSFAWNFYAQESRTTGASNKDSFVGMDVYIVLASQHADSYASLTELQNAASLNGTATGYSATISQPSNKKTNTGDQVFYAASGVGTGSQSFYYVVFDSANNRYWQSAVQSANTWNPDATPPEQAVAGNDFVDYATLETLATSSNWSTMSGGSGGTDVPEPTSGLLLVLGGAMLALRRRRA